MSPRRLAASFALVIAGLCLMAGCDAGSPSADVAAGQAAYQKYCALCHGDKGQGYQADAANALTNQDFLASVTDQFLFNGIAYGRPGTPMSAWAKARGGPLTDVQVTQIVAYLRSFQTQPAVDWSKVKVQPGVAERGQAAWAVECAGCHGPTGGGSPYMSVQHPQFLADVSDKFLRRVIAEGRPGTLMPGFAGVLSEQHIDDLVALLRSWQRPVGAPQAVTPATVPAQPLVNPGGPEPDFAAQSGRYVPAGDVKAAIDKGAEMLILDARPAGDYPNFHLPGALSVPFYAAADYAPLLPKNKWTVTYCACPHAESSALADALLAAGFTKVRVLDEGILFWQKQGWPLNKGTSP